MQHTSDGGGPIMYTGIEPISNILPEDFKLYQNYPNPFNPTTKISFSVKRQRSNVKLNVYDATGKLVSELVNQSLSAGTYEVEFNSNNNLTSGVYFYVLIADNPETSSGQVFKETKKMLLVK